MLMGQAWGENKITGCVCESFRFEFCLNFKRDEEAILKVLNVSSYKIDLTKPMISLNTKGTDRQSDESDHEEVRTGVNC